jgi:hypothetical protein
MLDRLTSDPLLVILAVAATGMAIAVWFQLRRRMQSYGGGTLASIAVGVALVAILVSISGLAIPIEYGLPILILGLVIVYRPDLTVRYTGGARKDWALLRDLRALDQERAELGADEVASRVAALERYRSPATAELLDLVLDAERADPDDPSLPATRTRIAELRASMRAALPVRPSWEPRRSELARDAGA